MFLINKERGWCSACPVNSQEIVEFDKAERQKKVNIHGDCHQFEQDTDRLL